MNHKIDRVALAAIVRDLQGISSEDKAALLELIRDHKKYGLVWENKPENVEERLREEIPVLREVTDRAIISDDTEAPNHILIEGDNLEALTALSYTHEGRIDVIYIDPPYNTGNKDFIYNDCYVDAEDEYRHSKWLSFMSKRLKIAKRLLSEHGVVFVSIDENEVAQLRLLADEIFSPNNFVGQWNWFKSATPPALSKKIKRNIEYILCWKNGNNNDIFKGVVKTSSSNDPFTKPQNSYKELIFPPKSITCKMSDGFYKSGIYGTDKFPNELMDDLIVEDGKNKNIARFRNRFIWLQSTLDENIKKGLYIELSKKLVLSYKRGEYSPEVPPNLIDMSVGVDTTENAGRQLAEIFYGKQPFDYPKPISLLKYILGFPYDKNITILDFFAGSGTTLHATMQLNAEDGGHRQCIIVTNNENNICEEVTYERNKRVINGYTNPKGEKVEGLHNNNLRYYQIDFIDREQTEENKQKLMKASTALICIKEDVYAEKDNFFGLKLPKQAIRYFEEKDRRVLVIYNPEVIPYLVKKIVNNIVVSNPIQIYVLSEGQYPYTSDFEAVLDKVELHAMPHSLYQVYRQVLPAKKAAQEYKDLPEMNEKELNEIEENIYKSEDYD